MAELRSPQGRRDRRGGQGRPDGTGNPGQQSALGALEQALGQALASLPHEQVLRCVAAALPIEVAADPEARLHAGKVRKVSVSMPAELTEAVRARTGSGGFSRYVTGAVQEQVRLDLLDELSAELEKEFGPIPPEIRAETRRQWPDYEEE